MNSTDSPDTSSGSLVDSGGLILTSKSISWKKKNITSHISHQAVVSTDRFGLGLGFCLFLWGFVPLFFFFLLLRYCVLHLFLSAAVTLSVFLSRVNVSAVRLL